MQIMKCFIRLAAFLCPAFAFAQSTYIPLGSKAYDFIDRMEIKLQENKNLNFSTVKPYNRKAIVKEVEYLDSTRMTPTDSARGFNKYGDRSDLILTPVDEYNLRSLLMNNSEWVLTPRPEFKSVTPVLKNFYKTKANLLEVNTKDLFLAINPILNLQFGASSGGNGIYLNTRGVSARGMISNRVGFSALITENQEKGPQFFQDRVNQFRAVPGVGFYKPFKKNGYDYFDARGYITFNAAKYIDFQFGYDKNFIGNGYRSLFLSDYGNSYLFFKINTRIWKFNYQNIFMELMPQFKKMGIDTLLDRKYAAMHHLSMDVTKWLNIGLFEGIIFGRKNHFDFQYLNPVIFYRHIEGTVGSPDNAVAGIDFKANVAHAAQVYGQLLLDEFVLAQIKKNTGYWANKYAVQLGFKYVDAFNINNLDIQVETNIARPFTYSHNDTIANYTHYNQPLAHPLGGNFREFIGILKYQPKPKIYLNAKLIYYIQGLDSAGFNFGSNPLENYISRPRDFGFFIGSGYRASCLNASFAASYELKENLFVDATALFRTYKIRELSSTNNTKMLTVGIRWNIGRREYDY
jgi:hypothetical protein